MKKSDIRGALNLSFGMIFSIILIIFFLVFAFYGIRLFINMQNSAITGKFLDDLQTDINQIWRAQEGSKIFEYNLPSKINLVCFIDSENQQRGENTNIYSELTSEILFYGREKNLVFFPILSNMGSAEIKNIDLGSITSQENPFCIESERGKIKLKIEKNFDDALVRITRI